MTKISYHNYGASPFSNTLLWMRTHTVPETPRDLFLKADSPTSITVTWEPPAEFYGIPDFYFISYTRVMDGSSVSDS